MAHRLSLNQVATYWSPTGNTDRYGKPLLNAPIQIECRWEDRRSQVIGKMGTEIVSKSRVFCEREIDEDGYLELGTVGAADPRGRDNAWEVQQVSKTPDLRNLQSLTTVYL